MSFMSRLFGWIGQLPPAETHDIAVEKDIHIPMRDGAVLLANHFSPRNLDARPTMLMRSAYSERVKAPYLSEIYAERGFHVLTVSSRGRFGSTGEDDPFLAEAADGGDVIAWLRAQPWFNGEIVSAGASYQGYTAWADAHAAGASLKAMSPQLIGADFHRFLYPGDAFALELFMFWIGIHGAMTKPALAGVLQLRRAFQKRRTRSARSRSSRPGPTYPVSEVSLRSLGPWKLSGRPPLRHRPGSGSRYRPRASRSWRRGRA